jgi:KDO2-lipid IV(A) lauroyltransferase
MQYVLYLVFRGVIFLFRMMPFRLVYALSDFFYLIIYHVVGYRKEVVYKNLRNSFPEKSEEEINVIARKFYHHFCDVFLESAKVFTVPTEEVVRRYRFTNTEYLDGLADAGISAICVAGHYNNWEWGGIVASRQMKLRAIGFYKPLSNRYIDQYVARNRFRGRSRVASIEQTQHTFKEYSDVPSIFYMIADQSPPNVRMAYWVTFLHQDTAVLFGPERYARTLKLPVVYADVVKIRRGYYTVKFITLADDPASTKTGEITQKYMQLLEASINKHPEFYLWSHRRWKHKRVTSDG